MRAKLVETHHFLQRGDQPMFMDTSHFALDEPLARSRYSSHHFLRAHEIRHTDARPPQRR
jgi:hypothetical protein